MITRFYLDLINPLRGLGQTELINLIEGGQRGFLARLQWLYHHIEKKDPMMDEKELSERTGHKLRNVIQRQVNQ